MSETIQALLKQHHTPSLVNPNVSPNSNRQILLFNDGEICNTKGGWAFMNRTIFSMKPKLDNVDVSMPIIYGNNSYAILPSLEIALEIREKMKCLNN